MLMYAICHQQAIGKPCIGDNGDPQGALRRCDNHEDGLEPLVLVLAPLQLSHTGGNDDVRHELGFVIDLNFPIDPAPSSQTVSTVDLMR